MKDSNLIEKIKYNSKLGPLITQVWWLQYPPLLQKFCSPNLYLITKQGGVFLLHVTLKFPSGFS